MVVVDYFSKWIEAKMLAIQLRKNIPNFFHDHVLCRYETPRAVVTDHDTVLLKFFNKCECINIKHWKSFVVHNQGNGQAETTNKLILIALKKNL